MLSLRSILLAVVRISNPSSASEMLRKLSMTFFS